MAYPAPKSTRKFRKKVSRTSKRRIGSACDLLNAEEDNKGKEKVFRISKSVCGSTSRFRSTRGSLGAEKKTYLVCVHVHL